MNNKNCTKTKSGKLSKHYSAYKKNRRQYNFVRALKSHKIKLSNGWHSSTQKFFNKSLRLGRKQENLKSFLWLANTQKTHLIKP
jgi:hypothetical protein